MGQSMLPIGARRRAEKTPERGRQWLWLAKPVAEIFGISPSGAVLVRRDRFVAWRAEGADPEAKRTLAGVLTSLLQTAAA